MANGMSDVACVFDGCSRKVGKNSRSGLCRSHSVRVWRDNNPEKAQTYDNKQYEKRRKLRRAGRNCEDCGTSIAERHARSKRCEECQHQSQLARNRAAHERHRVERNKQRIKLRFKINVDEWLSRQNNKCAVCMIVFDGSVQMHVDHDHSCCPNRERCCGKCVRGIVCRHCNLQAVTSHMTKEVWENVGRYLGYLR